MRGFSTGGTYINFLTEDEGDERIQAAYGPSYERLIEIKIKWDPDNPFRMNKNIAPRGRKIPQRSHGIRGSTVHRRRFS